MMTVLTGKYEKGTVFNDVDVDEKQIPSLCLQLQVGHHTRHAR